MRAGFSLDSIVPDRTSSVALHQQLYQKLRGLIETRVLPYGTALPCDPRAGAGPAAGPEYGHCGL